MDKVRKIGQWVWLNKERMLLLGMVCFLCFRVYIVVYQESGNSDKIEKNPDGTPKKVHRAPGTEPVAGWQGNPPVPDLPPGPPARINIEALVRTNPFTVWATPKAETDREAVPEDLGITLVRIRPWADGAYRAGLRTKTLKYYEEGETFESFRLMRIDAENNSVEVYSEKLGRAVTLNATG